MQSDYSELEKLAKEKEDENRMFRSFLKFYDDLPDKEIDALVFKLTDYISSTIECTSCGRCCKELKPMLSEKYQQQLADRLAITVEQLRKQYLEFEDSDDEPGWQIKNTPCPFQENNKCTVYEARSENCRNYPYLYEPDFTCRTWAMLKRTLTCPIVFNVIEELKRELDFDANEFCY